MTVCKTEPHASRALCTTARSGRRRCLLLAVALCCLPGWTLAQQEYALKAAFMFHFLNFVTWPEDAFESPQAPFRICVIGPDPFGKLIEPITRKTAQGRPIELVGEPADHHPAACQLVFIGGQDPEQVRPRLQTWSRPGVLTVGDADGFGEMGGVIEYVMQGKRVRFAINDDAAENAGLLVSVKLRKVALPQ